MPTPMLVIGPSKITRSARAPIATPTRAAIVEEEEGRSAASAIRMGLTPAPIVGVSTREEVAVERARSARQAEVAHARGRKGQEEANPGLISASTWVVDPRAEAVTDPSDRSDYVTSSAPASQRRPDPDPAPTGPKADELVRTAVRRLVNPGPDISTSKQSADRDPNRGVGRIEYDSSEVDAMHPFLKAAIRNATEYTCTVCGVKGLSQNFRTKCDRHASTI